MMKLKQTPAIQRLLALVLTLAMTLSLCVTSALAEEDAPAQSTGFVNTTGTGEDSISLTAVRTFRATVPVAMTKEEADAAVADGNLQWNLTRTAPYLNEEMYPNYFKGTTLDQFPRLAPAAQEGEPPVSQLFFRNIVTSAEEQDGKVFLTVTFENQGFFGADLSVPHSSNAFMDYIGVYTLSPVMAGKSLGSVEVKLNAYDAFHTMDEVYEEIDAIANADVNFYVEKFSMGKSQSGYDMPYLIVAKNQAAVDRWLTICDQAEANPDRILTQLKNGTLDDVQVPVLFSNVHANETAATDSILAFAKMLVTQDEISMDVMTGLTQEGLAQLNKEMGPAGVKGSVAVPDLVKDTAHYLGTIQAGNEESGPVDMETYYEMGQETVQVSDLLDDIFFILVPEENVEGRMYMTRTSSGGFDLNRDNSFQTQAETQNMTHLIASYNPVSFTELHGRVESFQCEPCDPPHEPNFEYDLLAEHLMTGGQAFGNAAVSNNEGYNSYVIPQRDYLEYTGNKTADGEDETYWADPWDDMSTSYTPQYSMLHGTVAYTVECPAYNDDSTTALCYGQLGQAAYVAANKVSYLENQMKIFQRGMTNANSNDYDLVGQWFADQYDVEGAEMDVFRPVYDGEGENGNFYPECYLIPLDGQSQKNLQAAYEMLTWLARNDVKLMTTQKEITVDGVTYPAGTAVVPMYQAKRSVANGVLYNGTLITGWTILYSEGITAFNHTRGFDMATCVKPADYKTIQAACGAALSETAVADLVKNAKSSFQGAEGGQVILRNTSEASTAAVNALLKADKAVSLITEGDDIGSYLCSYADLKTVDNTYLVSAIGVEGEAPAAAPIAKAPVVYINGRPADSTAGYLNTKLVSRAAAYNYDRQSLELMGFQTTNDPAKADVIIGASAIDTAALAQIKAGKPYIGYGSAAVKSAAGLFEQGALARQTVSDGSMDALLYVTYPTSSMTTASYVAEGDTILYGYGAGFFSAIPQGAQTLVQVDPDKKPLEGFLYEKGEHYTDFLNASPQAIACQDGKLDVTLFANTLTNKVHQRDEFAMISNTVFARAAGVGTAEAPAAPTVPPVAPTFQDVAARAWYADTVSRVVEQGLMNGNTSTTFGPDVTMTRGMLVTVLHRLAKEPQAESAEFSDVAAGSYCAPAVNWAAANEIVGGVGKGKFAPDHAVSRQEVATILYRYVKSTGADVTVTGDLSGFDDTAAVSTFATGAMGWAVSNGIVTGVSGKLAPSATASRAEVAAMLLRTAALLDQ